MNLFKSTLILLACIIGLNLQIAYSQDTPTSSPTVEDGPKPVCDTTERSI